MDLSSLSRELAVETQRGDGLGTFESTARLSVSDQADSPPQNSVEEQTSAPESENWIPSDLLLCSLTIEQVIVIGVCNTPRVSLIHVGILPIWSPFNKSV